MAKGTLIIGCGNPQRCDDGVGEYVISQLEAKLPADLEAKAIVVHQLDVELVDEIKNWEQVILVDATCERFKRGWKCVKVIPEKQMTNFSHHLSPSMLLSLVESVHKKKPKFFIFSIKGYNFNFGSVLSPRTKKAADEVVVEILRLLKNQS
ncbi:MAG: hydrogenase maturation protease [Candidatus Hadarchaeum sp.]